MGTRLEDAWGPDWLTLDCSTQDSIVTKLTETEEMEDLTNWLCKTHGLSEERATAVARVRVGNKHGRLSEKALALIIPHMEQGKRYHEATTLEFGDHRSPGDGVHKNDLPYYGEVLARHTAFEKDRPESGDDTRNDEEKYGRVANPTVHVALNELRKVMNDLIRRWGPPEEVVLELARDLPLSGRDLRALESKQKKNQDLNDTRRKDLANQNVPENRENKLKQRLYQEALECFGGTVQCVFSGTPISVSSLFSADVEIEHILPLSRTNDVSFANQVLSTRRVNRIKKKPDSL